MVGERLGERIKVREELIKKACSLSFKAHKSPGKPYLIEKVRGGALPEVIFVFSGSWSVGDWFNSTSGKAFGETKVDLSLFPSLRNIGNVDEVAAVNDAFFRRFKEILNDAFKKEVNKAVTDKKQIVFAGHSSGAATAILATLWFLDHNRQVQPNKTQIITPLCITFGSPLLGDRIFPHSLRRENWDDFFIHFITKHDIVPRITLSPPSSIQQDFQTFLNILKTKSPIATHGNVSNFFVTIMKNVQSVTSHAACNMMGSTNPLLQTITSFVHLSPYRPFGKYILCSGNGKLVVVKNSDAVLQLLFYSCQLKSGEEIGEVGYERLKKEHFGYENELEESLEMQNVVYLDNYLKEVPLSSDASVVGEAATVNAALNDLGLSTRARLCLRAAGELQEQKQRNQTKINSNKKEIEEKLKAIKEYQQGCTRRNVGYYDTFKIQKDERDFQANVRRVELAGLWDEIIEMLKRYELPDEFEGLKEWIVLGTKYRRLVEPLDIANYYRHSKNEDTGPYLVKARPKRYRYTQRWHEHAERMAQGSSYESCFWAEVEELKSRNKPDEDMEKILELERHLSAWVERVEIGSGEIGSDMFLGESTFAKWWRELPEGHKRGSCLAQFMNN